MGYRAEIDGLRAVAVASIVLFHLDVDVFRGGFWGVDVFFVISGYLITRNLIRMGRRNNGRIDFFEFYAHRVARLFPSLFVVLLACFGTAYVLLTPSQFQEFGNSLLFSLLYVSNLFFWMDAGYFSTASELKPLLHTWSLGIEEQFYLLWPLVVLLLLKLRRDRARIGVVLFLVLASLLSGHFFFRYAAGFFGNTGNEWVNALISKPQQTAFFVSPFRFFELGMGALIPFLGAPRFKSDSFARVLSVCGVGLVAGSVLVLVDYAPLYALVPTIGTFVLIRHLRPGGLVYGALTMPAVVFIGKISYQLYLVHWPIIVFYRHWNREIHLEWAERILLLALTFIASYLLYRCVDLPNRLTSSVPERQRVVFRRPLAWFALTVGLVMPATLAADGNVKGMRVALFDEAEARQLAPRIPYNEARSLLRPERDARALLATGDDRTIRLLSVGNSHEPHGYLLVRNLLDAGAGEVSVEIDYSDAHMQGTLDHGNDPRCYFEKEAHFEDERFTTPNPDCSWLAEIYNDHDYVTDTYDGVVVSAHDPLGLGANYLAYAAALQRHEPTFKVIVVGSFVNYGTFRCADLVNGSGNIFACNEEEHVEAFFADEMYRIAASFPGLRYFYVDQIGLLCASRDIASCSIIEQGYPIIFDSNHFVPNLALPKMMDTPAFRMAGEDLGAWVAGREHPGQLAALR